MAPVELNAMDVDALPAVAVGGGCSRIDLPACEGVRTWIVDMQPGSTWPRRDQHDATGECVFVVSGEVIEGDDRYGPGTYLNFGPYSSHQPRTDTGVRLFGFNLTQR